MGVYLFFNDTATTEIYTLSLHDARPISARGRRRRGGELQVRPQGRRRRRGAAGRWCPARLQRGGRRARGDRKSTRLNSSHAHISYAVFCLKKKNPFLWRPTALGPLSRVV